MKKNISLVLFVVLLIISSISISHAEQRSIYIGDIITLEIENSKITKEILTSAFEEFEIVDLQEDEDKYILKIRSFEVGEKKVTIDNQDIMITVNSTLDDIERDDIFEGDLKVRDSQGYVSIDYFYYIMIAIFTASGILLLVQKIRMVKKEGKPPYQKCIESINGVDVSVENSLAEITMYFKSYIEAVFAMPIIGKTSSEIIKEIYPIVEISDWREDIHNWLEVCDKYKFSRVKSTKEERLKLKKEILKIIESINSRNEVK